MNWPDRQLPPDKLAKLDAKIKEFCSVASDLSGAEGALEVQKVCIDLYRIWKGSTDTFTKEELLAKGASWDTEKPELAQIQKYLNRILSGRLEEASGYFEGAEEHKKSIIIEGVAQAKSQSAKANANKRHANNNAIKKKAVAYYQLNKHDYIDKGDAARDLEKRFPPLGYHAYYKALKGL